MLHPDQRRREAAQPAESAMSQPIANRGRSSRHKSATMPRAVNRICEATRAVFEITTEASAVLAGRCQRRRR
jgi:hypothetical protein